MKFTKVIFLPFIFMVFLLANAYSQDHLQSGLEKFNKGEYRAAIEDFTKAVEESPESSTAHFHLGEAYFFAGRYDSAEESFRKTISLDNKYAIAYKRLYEVLIKSKNYEDAWEILQKSVEQVGYFFGNEPDTSIKLAPGDSLDILIPVVKQPQPIKQPTPKYPELARRTGLEGTVYVKILIGEDGKPKRAVVYKSDAEVFDESAIEAAMNSMFMPAIMKGEPVACWVVIPYMFKLKN